MSPQWQVFLDSWTAAIVRASWQGAVAIGLVWVVCRMFPRIPPRYRCWLWRLALLKMVLAVFPIASLDVPILPASWAVSRPAVASTDPGRSVALFVGWAAVVFAFLGVLAVRVAAARRQRRQWRLIKDPDLLTIGERLANRMGLFQPPVLFESETCVSPVVFGAVRTLVVLPSSLLSQSTPAEMRLILAHEMAHIRRGDLLGNWFSTVVSSLFFFHPMVWLASRECRLDGEMACDEMAVREPDASAADYGRLLVALATRFRSVRLNIATVGVVESFQVLLKRRLRALRTVGSRSFPLLAASWCVAAAAVLGLLPWRLVAAPTTPADSPLVLTRTVDSRCASGPFSIAVDRARLRPGEGFVVSAVPSGLPLTPADFSGRVEIDESRPHLILDLLVQSPKTSKGRQWLCNVTGPVHGLDDQGRSCDGSALTGIFRWRMRDVDYVEGDGRGAIHLRLPTDRPKATSLRFITGTLQAAEGQVHQVVFDKGDVARLTGRTPDQRREPVRKEWSSSRDSGSILVTDVDFARDGVNVVLAVPSTIEPGTKTDLIAYQARMWNALGRVNLVLRDSLGRDRMVGFVSGRRLPERNEGVGPTISATDGTMHLSLGGWPSSRAFPFTGQRFDRPMLMLQCHFDPLPPGVDVESFRCEVTELTGSPRMIPFRLEDIPLPEEGK